MSRNDSPIASQEIRETVRAGYAAIAVGNAAPRGSSSCCSGSSCCTPDAGDDAQALASAIGYGAEDLATLPEGANMGLSCGNPTALAQLQPGETIVDLGSGGGFDIFIAGRRVGPSGRAIGVDMTPEMISKARRNALQYRQTTGLDNVEFRLGEIEHLPIADASVDAIISNCVINLSPDKPQVWREIARVLRPGGRVAVSDIALVAPLPPEVLSMVEGLVGCVAGAVLISETESMARAAGLVDIALERKDAYVEAMTTWNDPLYARIIAALPEGSRVSDYVTSLNVTARRPS